jgi:hypothetical protein
LAICTPNIHSSKCVYYIYAMLRQNIPTFSFSS